MKVRNAANDGWEDVGGVGGGAGWELGGNTDGAELIGGTLDDFDVVLLRNGVEVMRLELDGVDERMYITGKLGVAGAINQLGLGLSRPSPT